MLFFLKRCYAPINYPVLSHSQGSAQIKSVWMELNKKILANGSNISHSAITQTSCILRNGNFPATPDSPPHLIGCKLPPIYSQSVNKCQSKSVMAGGILQEAYDEFVSTREVMIFEKCGHKMRVGQQDVAGRLFQKPFETFCEMSSSKIQRIYKAWTAKGD